MNHETSPSAVEIAVCAAGDCASEQAGKPRRNVDRTATTITSGSLTSFTEEEKIQADRAAELQLHDQPHRHSTVHGMAGAAVAASKSMKKRARIITKLHKQFEVTLGIMIGISDAVNRHRQTVRELLLFLPETEKSVAGVYRTEGFRIRVV